MSLLTIYRSLLVSPISKNETSTDEQPQRGDKMQKSLYPYREASMTPLMWIIMIIGIIIFNIMIFLIMQVPSLA